MTEKVHSGLAEAERSCQLQPGGGAPSALPRNELIRQRIPSPWTLPSYHCKACMPSAPAAACTPWANQARTPARALHAELAEPAALGVHRARLVARRRRWALANRNVLELETGGRHGLWQAVHARQALRIAQHLLRVRRRAQVRRRRRPVAALPSFQGAEGTASAPWQGVMVRLSTRARRCASRSMFSAPAAVAKSAASVPPSNGQDLGAVSCRGSVRFQVCSVHSELLVALGTGAEPPAGCQRAPGSPRSTACYLHPPTR